MTIISYFLFSTHFLTIINILIPHSWLLDFLKTDVKPEEIGRLLSLAGPSVESVSRQGNDWVYDIEVTTNRIDMYSVLGIALEAAVILGSPIASLDSLIPPP